MRPMSEVMAKQPMAKQPKDMAAMVTKGVGRKRKTSSEGDCGSEKSGRAA